MLLSGLILRIFSWLYSNVCIACLLPIIGCLCSSEKNSIFPFAKRISEKLSNVPPSFSCLTHLFNQDIDTSQIIV